MDDIVIIFVTYVPYICSSGSILSKEHGGPRFGPGLGIVDLNCSLALASTWKSARSCRCGIGPLEDHASPPEIVSLTTRVLPSQWPRESPAIVWSFPRCDAHQRNDARVDHFRVDHTNRTLENMKVVVDGRQIRRESVRMMLLAAKVVVMEKQARVKQSLAARCLIFRVPAAAVQEHLPSGGSDQVRRSEGSSTVANPSSDRYRPG